MSHRQEQRTQLRKINEFLSRRLAPSAPRRIRRLTGRVYANAAYRQLHDLNHNLYGDGPHGYTKFSTQPQIVKWMLKEWERLTTPVPELPEPSTMERLEAAYMEATEITKGPDGDSL